MTKFIACGLIAASLLSAPAFAADFGVVDQPVPAGFEAPNHDWTGFYAGIFGGLTTGENEFSVTGAGVPGGVIPFLTLTSGGGLAGVQLGANYQMNQFVLGAVADIALTNHKAQLGAGIPGGGAAITSGLSTLATVRARAGYSFGNVMAYVHGGLAYGRSDDDTGLGGVGPVGATDNLDHVGYTVGAGVEYAINDTISLQTEYAYTDLGKDVIATAPGPISLNEQFTFHTVKAGINFSF